MRARGISPGREYRMASHRCCEVRITANEQSHNNRNYPALDKAPEIFFSFFFRFCLAHVSVTSSHVIRCRLIKALKLSDGGIKVSEFRQFDETFCFKILRKRRSSSLVDEIYVCRRKSLNSLTAMLKALANGFFMGNCYLTASTESSRPLGRSFVVAFVRFHLS